MVVGVTGRVILDFSHLTSIRRSPALTADIGASTVAAGPLTAVLGGPSPTFGSNALGASFTFEIVGRRIRCLIDGLSESPTAGTFGSDSEAFLWRS